MNIKKAVAKEFDLMLWIFEKKVFIDSTCEFSPKVKIISGISLNDEGMGYKISS